MATETIDDREIIGHNIRRIREGQGFSVDQVLARTGLNIARGYWYEIERGEVNVTIDQLTRIAEALGVTVRDFFERKFWRGRRR